MVFISIGTVSSQQQYFRVQPRDVKVHEGGEAMLECEVANLAGQVQWTKDGFALGEMRIHFLKISSVKGLKRKHPQSYRSKNCLHSD